ncbi:hypothetical protein K503DRAFT_502386 [Rhizopogon vinicolor AM-OR11-026]|uniref:Uncharacterized protein n=1 Tax=Rhizopogon vinicolor AM-OR11-026 TaxID=1314800 RepID=A0A1B7N9A4_9AGAM|nr:hypothetical protein K503DRAFT_502386 [Rhizopogon vinicolor AM-OR11-026]
MPCSAAVSALHTIARAYLYNDIRLYQHNTPHLFLRTVRESFGGHCPAHALHLKCDRLTWGYEDAEGYSRLAGEIITCCTKLRYLEGDHWGLRYACASGSSLPEYPYLKKLKVFSLNFWILPPLLSRFNLHTQILREGVPSSLETFAFSWYRTTVQHEVRKLLRWNWQPSLWSLDVYHPIVKIDSEKSFESRHREPYN